MDGGGPEANDPAKSLFLQDKTIFLADAYTKAIAPIRASRRQPAVNLITDPTACCAALPLWNDICIVFCERRAKAML